MHRPLIPTLPPTAPLVGFSIIEAADVDEVVELVAGTPCAVAHDAIEVLPLVEPSA